MTFRRRTLLKRGLLAGVGVGLPLGTVAGPASRLADSMAVTSPEVDKFEVPLPVPPVLDPVVTEESTDYYELTQQEATAEILPGYETTVWGYDGIFPGPTIEARRGREAVVDLRNELPVPTVTHLHGGVTPPDSDGFPTDFVLPAGMSLDDVPGHLSGTVDGASQGSKTYCYPNDQRASTLWYHDHRMDFTGPQVYKGLAGFYLIRDEIEDDLSLPEGDREIPLLIADRTFTDDGEFYYPSVDPSLMGDHGVLASTSLNEHTGVFGDTLLVNGAPWPRLAVSNTKYRFRILNASNARTYELALDPAPSDGSSFVQIGSDGGLLSEPVSHDRLRVSPAERFDVIVDFSQYDVGSKITLKNRRGEGHVADVMQFVVDREAEETSGIPDRLAPPLKFPDPNDATERRRFTFIAGVLGGMSTINNRAYDPSRVDARPQLGSTEIWEFDADPSHPIHMHLVHFKVISRDGGPPGPYDAGWKDTVFLDGGTVRVVARFGPYRGKYVFHCHNLEHEDRMMMANFEVV